MRAVTILSGGMDSATLSYGVASQHGGEEDEYIHQHFISFDYGQKHRKELECAAAIASFLKSPHHIIDLTSVGPLLKGSALTDNIEMPEGHYAEENMRLTVVPNRNAIMLSVAYGIAVGEKANFVYFGAHAGDHYIYPDCRIEFVNALAKALQLGNESTIKIYAPFINEDKAQILAKGLKMGVPYQHTWTCYKGGAKACGVCGSCQERLWAFEQNKATDPLPYASRKLFAKGEKVGAD